MSCKRSQLITDNGSVEGGIIPHHRRALHLCYRLQLRLVSAGCSAAVHAAAAIALTLASLDWKHLAPHKFEAAPLAHRANSLHLLAGSIGRIASSTSPCRVLLRQSPSCPQPHLERCSVTARVPLTKPLWRGAAVNLQTFDRMPHLCLPNLKPPPPPLMCCYMWWAFASRVAPTPPIYLSKAADHLFADSLMQSLLHYRSRGGPDHPAGYYTP